MFSRPEHLRLIAVLSLSLLMSCSVAVEASARAPKQPTEAPASDSIALELRELGETPRSIEFVVPLDGRIAGWTELYGERHYCRLDAVRNADERINLHMRCGRARDLSKLDLEFDTVRSFEPGAATLLAEFTPTANQRVQVVATRR